VPSPEISTPSLALNAITFGPDVGSVQLLPGWTPTVMPVDALWI
jgi:hypothetical protein